MTIVAGVNVGDVLAGKYRVERIIGAGGMGVVVSAHHLQLDERVAIKFLLPDALANEEAVARFAREARAAVKIKNEHVARVSDVGTLETGAPYMVMEYLEGIDLATMVKQRGALPVGEVVDYVLQACEALAEAHGLGIIHRDLKPSNLFVIRRSDGSTCVKLLDFGISKVTGLAGSGGDMGMTKTATVMGSPLYMSPEQMESSRNVDPRTDVWALGIILYELLSGSPPFVGETLPEICIKIATHALPPLASRRSGIPNALEAAIARCVEKDRNRRFANVAELAHALGPFAPPHARVHVERVSRIVQSARHSAPGFDAPVGAGSGTVLISETAGAWGTTSPRSGGRRKAAWWLLAVAVAGVAGAAAVVLRAPPATPATPVAVLPAEAQSPAAAPPGEAPRPPFPVAPTETAKEEPAVLAATADVAPDTRLRVMQDPTSIPAPPSTSPPARPAWRPAPRVVNGPSGGNAPRPGASSTPKPAAAKGDVYDDRK